MSNAIGRKTPVNGLGIASTWLAALLFAAPACQTGTSGDEVSGQAPGSSERGVAVPPAPRAEYNPLQIDPLISTQQAKLLAGAGAAVDLFGAAVALSGDTALVGAARDDERGTDAGAAYVFVRSGSSWTQQAKLLADVGAANDNFGASVALSGDTALVGARFADGAASDTGAAYVFVRSGSSWTQQAKLLATDGSAADQLGISVALSGDTALVGTIDDDDSGDRSGAAYVFVRSGTSWSQQAKLLPADGATRDQFGISVALSGDTALVGAWGDDDLGNSAGTAFVFVRSGTSWTQQAKLTAADGAAADLFGSAVALSNTTALAGALGDDDLGSSSGSAYVYRIAASGNGGACTTNADCGSGFCTDGVCCDTACGGGDPNDCQACSVAAGAAVDGTCGPRAAGIVCRAAANGCDVAETCTGSSASCPGNALKPDLSLCYGGLLGLPGVCLSGSCVL